jgi:hypothetical protein
MLSNVALRQFVGKHSIAFKSANRAVSTVQRKHPPREPSTPPICHSDPVQQEINILSNILKPDPTFFEQVADKKSLDDAMVS